MTVAARTAEWICTRCGVTNRKLVPLGQDESRDRCVTCHARHHLDEGDTPVRWLARAE